MLLPMRRGRNNSPAATTALTRCDECRKRAPLASAALAGRSGTSTLLKT